MDNVYETYQPVKGGSEDNKTGGPLPTDSSERIIANGALKPCDCAKAYLVRTARGWRWQRCNRPKCSAPCRAVWAWKHAGVLCRSARELPPTHFATVAPRAGMTDADFGKASAKFFATLVRLLRGLQWFRVREWAGGRVHDHALIRADGVSRRAVRKSKLLACVRASVRPVRSVFAACRYLVKHGRWSSKAEVVPKDFSDKLFTSSRKFLVRPFADLWKEIRGERSGKRGVA